MARLGRGGAPAPIPTASHFAHRKLPITLILMLTIAGQIARFFFSMTITDQARLHDTSRKLRVVLRTRQRRLQPRAIVQSH